MLTAIILTIVCAIAYLALYFFDRIFATVFLFIVFWFAYANASLSATLPSYYLFGIVYLLIFQIAKSRLAPDTASSGKVFSERLNGKVFYFVLVGFGFLLFLAMRLIQSQTTNAILGTPTLAIASLVGPFDLLLVTMLGIIENGVFFSIFEMLSIAVPYIMKFMRLAFLGPVLPYTFTALLFGLFHISSYGLRWAAIGYASIVMLIFVLSYKFTKSTLPADVAHASWNAAVTIGNM